MMKKKTDYNVDVAIVGAGPAGTTATYILAKKGCRVLIIDKEKFPRKKCCGGALTAKTMRLLSEIFNETENSLTNKRIINFKSNRYEIRYKNKLLLNKKSTYTFSFVDRYVYDDFFMKKAKSVGANVLEGERVSGINTEQNELITAQGTYIKARFIIAADGANSILRTKLFRENKLDGSRWRKNLAYAVEVFTRQRTDFETIDYPILSFGYLKYGYAWIFPNRDRLVVGMGGLPVKKENLTDRFKTFLADFALPLNDSEKTRGYPLPFGNFLAKPIYKKILLIGDAAGLVDPMLGEGIYQAHKSGELAACAIIETINGAADSDAETGKKNMTGNRRLEQNYLELLNSHLLPELFYARRYRRFVYNKLNHISKFRVVGLLASRFEKLAELVHGDRSYRRPRIKKNTYSR
ncbi:NAD(P)/FAD-dependent oxidoreductase [Acidobacteriota bacterium]